MRYDVSVVIPTFNAEEFLEELFKSIFRQITDKKYEVLVIDSGSSDRTLDIIEKHPSVRLHQIPNSEFGHGRTRNLAAKLAEGEYILYLTQDAVPSHDGWLDSIIEPFSISDKVACVFGKQIPRPDCAVTVKREITTVFKMLGPDDAVVLHRKNELTESLNLVNTFMSNANSAVRRDLLLEIPFRDVNYAEDQGLGIDMLDTGYYKAYSPLGSVYHSHNYPLGQYFRRKYDEWVGLRETTGLTAKAGYRELVFGSAKSTLQDWRFLLKDREYSFSRKLGNFITAPFYNILLRLAIRAAAHKKLSSKHHQKFSLEAQNRKKAKH